MNLSSIKILLSLFSKDWNISLVCMPSHSITVGDFIFQIKRMVPLGLYSYNIESKRSDFVWTTAQKLPSSNWLDTSIRYQRARSGRLPFHIHSLQVVQILQSCSIIWRPQIEAKECNRRICTLNLVIIIYLFSNQISNVNLSTICCINKCMFIQ